MSTLGEHKGNGNLTETSRQPEDTKAQIYGILRSFDVFPSKWDRLIFRYISVSLITLFFLDELVFILFLGSSSQLQAGRVLLGGGSTALLVVGMISVLWPFNVWRVRIPKTLRDLFEEKRIAVPKGDTNALYLRFLEDYRDALASPKRYILSGFPMILVGILKAYVIVHFLSVELPNIFVTISFVGGNLIEVFFYVGGLYSIGIVAWVIYISGWYVRKLLRVFELSIQPFHTDKCGGLKSLGNFCFGLGSPILLGSGFLIGYILLLVVVSSGVGLALIGGIALLILLYFLPAAIFAFILPLRDIHTKMVSKGQIDENIYNARIKALREEIQALLESNQVEEAKIVQEKKAVWETLHTPYPAWPFRFHSKIISTVLGVSGSLLLGVITAALEQYFLPAILALLFHTP
jgi:hypothetical protein